MAGNLVLGTVNLPMIFPFADTNGDGLIGLAETYYALNWAAFTGQLTAEMSGSVLVGQAAQLMVRNFVLGPVTVTDASETSATLTISVRMP